MRHRYMQVLSGAVVALALLGSTVASAAVRFKRLATVNGTTAQAVAMARSADGTLHLLYQTYAGKPSGLAAMSISPAGAVGSQVQALSGWSAGQPGLVAFPNGTLEGAFGATSPGNVADVWGIGSANGGATWSAPVSVSGGGSTESLAYASNITAAMSGATPVLTLPQAGSLFIQRGLGPGSPSYQVNNASDGSLTDADVGVDAATGEVVAGWDSIAHNPTLYLQGVAPVVGAPQRIPGQSHNAVVLAGRDKGAGVFAAYSADGTHVRLLRYGGGSVAVGRLRGVTANVLGVATGPNGRIWVMWGDENGGVAVTRSNMAVTRFEPIQHFNPNAFTLYRLSGDGRLGPLDLFVDEIPNAKTLHPAGNYYARVLPELSAGARVTRIKSKKGKLLGFKLIVRVSDAGDAVPAAKVSANGKKKMTNKLGIATITLASSVAGAKLRMSISAAGYQQLGMKVKVPS
jgi:hypothetical protein